MITENVHEKALISLTKTERDDGKTDFPTVLGLVGTRKSDYLFSSFRRRLREEEEREGTAVAAWIRLDF